MRVSFALAVAVAVGLAVTALADYPAPALFSEQQPPTLEDWHRLELRRMQRCCPHCGPIVIPREIHYYPCPREKACNEPVHRSDMGVYGREHPMPYYLPNPEIVVRVPGRCPQCSLRYDWRFRQELTTVSEKRRD
jgi:hypothetical protein